VPFKEKSYVKYNKVQYKNKENGPGKIEGFKIFIGKQIQSVIFLLAD